MCIRDSSSVVRRLGVAVVATPYDIGTDHWSLSKTLHSDFEAALQLLPATDRKLFYRRGDRDDLGLRILRLGFGIRGLLVLEDGFVRVVSGFIRKRPGSVRAPLRPRLLRGRD